MKILNAFLALMFIAFACLQYNDPDPLGWILVYGVVAVLCAMAALGRPYPRWGVIATAIVIGGWMLWLLPSMVNWIGMGMPSITGTMQAHEPYIEEVREFLGLLIALLAVLHLMRAGRRKA